MHFHFQISHAYWKQEGGLFPFMLCNPINLLTGKLKIQAIKKVLLSALESGSPECVIWVKSCNLHSHE